MAGKAKTDWGGLEEEYINLNLIPERDGPYTLKMLAEAHDMSYAYLRSRASKFNWAEKLKAAKLAQSDKSVSLVSHAQVFNEVDVRVRHATYARLAQSKAVVRLNNLESEKLTIREAIDLMRLGMEMERKSLGMPDTFIYQEIADKEGFSLDDARSLISEIVSIYSQEMEGEDLKQVIDAEFSNEEN